MECLTETSVLYINLIIFSNQISNLIKNILSYLDKIYFWYIHIDWDLVFLLSFVSLYIKSPISHPIIFFQCYYDSRPAVTDIIQFSLFKYQYLPGLILTLRKTSVFKELLKSNDNNTENLMLSDYLKQIFKATDLKCPTLETI